ncbi:hypothetical protein C8Q74DRAFT_1328907 [Fomes fomentarius]|nr:hypothetical protein C8Q74DRAFT_1328907 [Fomes fomentarius]
MSIETFSLCNPDLPAGGEVHHNSNIVKQAWTNELRDCIHIIEISVELFIDHLVPCGVPYLPSEDLDIQPGPFAQYLPRPGGEIMGSCSGLLSGLRRLVTSFPADKRLKFADTHANPLPFPFAAFAPNHHNSKPDLSISFPGKDLDLDVLLTYPWRDIASVIEVKPDEKDDPFYDWKKGYTNNDKILQIARNARNLMLVHGFLASYVIGIYGEYARLIRFDHSCALVSKRFVLKENPELLQKFFWHFVNPCFGKTVVGCDPSIACLSFDDVAWVKKQLGQRGENLKTFNKDVLHGRRMQVYDQKTDTSSWYIVYKAVDINAHLFSRATMVWRTIEDTRGTPTSRPPKSGILKESWRQVVRRSETSFYYRLADKIPEAERYGLTKLECGGDLGEVDVRLWEQSTPYLHLIPDEQRQLRLSATQTQLKNAKPSSPSPNTSRSPSTTPSPSPSSSPSPTACATIGHSDSSARHPLPYPLHQTFSWTFALGPKMTYRERSHMRFVVADVGRPVYKFKNTEELVTALQDAVKGHEQAYTKAGILHRDVSIGNILIVDNPSEGSFVGFIHDFDYSSIEVEDDPPELIDDMPIADEDDQGHVTGIIIRKERTGTFYFMAMDLLAIDDFGPIIHGVHHDLESVYWVLLWVVFRHTKHSLGPERCGEVFKYGSDREAYNAKMSWIGTVPGFDMMKSSQLVVENNEPLTTLLHEFRCLVRRQLMEIVKLDYESVLAIFDEALKKHNWPKDDWVEFNPHGEYVTVAGLIAPAPPSEVVRFRALLVLPLHPHVPTPSDRQQPVRDPQYNTSAPPLLAPAGVGTKRRCDALNEPISNEHPTLVDRRMAESIQTSFGRPAKRHRLTQPERRGTSPPPVPQMSAIRSMGHGVESPSGGDSKNERWGLEPPVERPSSARSRCVLM